MPKLIIGENWKGLGDTWVDDDPSKCVDSLNVLSSKDGKWLQSRPGFKDCGINNSTNEVYGIAVIPYVDANGSVGYITTANYNMAQVKFNASTDIASIVTNASAISHFDTTATGYSKGTQLKGISDNQALYIFSRDYTGTALWKNTHYHGPSAAEYFLPLMDWQGKRIAALGDTYIESGLYGAHPTLRVESITESTRAGGLMTASKTYYVDFQWLVKDADGNILAQSTPYHVLSGKRPQSLLLTASGTGIYVFTGYETTADEGDFGLKTISSAYKNDQFTVESGTTYQNGWHGFYPSSITEDGTPLTYKPTLAEVNATQGTWTANGTTQKIYINATGGGNITTNGKLYKDNLYGTTDYSARNWIKPTHIRLLRSVANTPDLYYHAEEYKVNQLMNVNFTLKAATTYVYQVSNYGIQPTAVYENGTSLGAKKASTAEVEAAAGSWFSDGTYTYIHSTDNTSVLTNGKTYTVDLMRCVYVSELADTSLVTEFDDVRGAPSMLWTGEFHNNRLFGAASDHRVAWNKFADIWFSEAGNYLTFRPENYFLAGDGDVPTAMLSLPGQGSLLILTNLNAYILTGDSPDNYSLTKIGENCGCFSVNGAGKHGPTAAWFGPDSVWMFDGNNPRRVTGKILRRQLSAIDGSINKGHGCMFDGQLWYRKLEYCDSTVTSRPGYVYDFETGATWRVDRVIEAVRNYPQVEGTYEYSATAPNNSWSVTTAGYADNSRAFCKYATTLGNAPASIGQFLISSYREDTYNHYDQSWVSGTTWANAEMTRNWVGSWQTFGDRKPKKITRIRLIASPNTVCNVTVEASDNYTESTTKTGNFRTLQMTNNQEADFGVSGKYIRFRIDGLSTSELKVRRLEVEYDAVA